MLLGPLMPAAPLAARPEAASLLPGPEPTAYLDARLQACTHDAGCLVALPDNRMPALLAAPLRQHWPVAAARTLLPPGAQWLLAAHAGAGPALSPSAVVPPAPRVGQPASFHSTPFDLVARQDRLPAAAMFLAGIVLFIGSAALGLVVRHPAEPVIPAAEEPFIPANRILPPLVASPRPVVTARMRP
jgi:hypothetical protein